MIVFLLGSGLLTLISIFLLYEIFETKDNEPSESDVILMHELKDVFLVLVAEPWDKTSKMDNFHTSKILKDMDVDQTDNLFRLNSNGFAMTYNKDSGQYTLSLHTGTSSNFSWYISDALKTNFAEVDKHVGSYFSFLVSFDFSKKTSPVRYHENDFMIN